MYRRRFILVSSGVLVPDLAGCLSTGETDTPSTSETPSELTETDLPETSSQTESQTTERTTATETRTESPPDHTDLSDEPSYDKSVIAQNFAESSEDLTVLVWHDESESLVFEDSITLDPDEEREVFRFEEIEAEFGGVESFRVSVSLANGREDEVTIATNACYGNVRIDVDEDGELLVYYSIC